MKTGISLTELARQLEERKGQKKDLIVPANQLVAVPVFNSENGSSEVKLEVPKHGLTSINSVAHDQIGTFTEIPARYYDRMLREEPGLLVSNINTWLGKQKDDTKRMVRQLGQTTRAFLSNRYQRIENEEIAEMALPILIGDSQMQVVSTEITDKRLYIQATTPRVQGEVKKGDVVQTGVIISNSEVGHGAVSVQRVVYRLVCLNGMIRPDGRYRANHTGARLDDNEALWADDTRKADDKAILLKVRDMVRAAMDPTVFESDLRKMQEAAGQKITGNPEKAVEVLSQKLGFTENEKGGFLRSLIEGGDLSRWGFANAVTHQAHTAANYDRSVDFEALGSRVIDLPDSEWNVVANAGA